MKFRRKPIVVEAIQWDGTNEADLIEFDNLDNCIQYEFAMSCIPAFDLTLKTQNGFRAINPFDWVVKYGPGNYEVFSSELFEKTYEKEEIVKPCIATMRFDGLPWSREAISHDSVFSAYTGLNGIDLPVSTGIREDIVIGDVIPGTSININSFTKEQIEDDVLKIPLDMTDFAI
jgi:hypothetical protein